MRAIGIRELRQQASKHLHDVQRGETIEVTDRGRPVARLVPVPGQGDRSDLVQSGRLVTANGDALDLGPPLAPSASTVLPSDRLAGLRADER